MNSIPKWLYLSILIMLSFLLINFQPSRELTPVSWNLQPHTLQYLVQQQDFHPETGAVASTWYDTITLVFQQPAGQVLAMYNDEEIPSTMTENGRIYPKDPNKPYLYWELFFLAVLPPDGDAQAGDSWTVKRPEDREITQNTSIVGQSQIQYQINSTGPLQVSYTGETRIAPSQGLATFTRNLELSPLVMRQLLMTYKPLVKGKAVFSEKDGAAISAEGLIVPFAAFGEGEPVETQPGRIQFRITRM